MCFAGSSCFGFSFLVIRFLLKVNLADVDFCEKSNSRFNGACCKSRGNLKI